MTKLLNSIYLGASTPSDYGNFVGGVELLPYDYYLGSAVPSGGADYVDVILSGVSPLTLEKAISLNYLKLFGGTEQRNIPSEYTQVEYLQSSGTQYINTGIVLKSEATITMVAQADTVTSGGPYAFWGLMGSDTFPRWGWSIYSTAWLTDLNQTNTASTANTQKHTFVNSCFYTGTDLYYNSFVDGNVLFTNSRAVTQVETYTNNTLSAYLFARNNNGTAGNFLACKIFSYEIVQDGIKVLSLIPCKRNSDNVLGMYDTITGNFLTNSGTGTFTAGADAVPTPDTPMDIVSNNGVLKLSPNLLNDTNVVNAYSATGNYTYKGFFVNNISLYSSDANYRIAHCVLPAGSYRFETDTANAYILRYAIGSTITEIFDDNQKQYIDFTLTTTTEFSICWRNSTTTEFTDEHSWISKGATPYRPYGQIYTDGAVETVQVTGKNLFDKDISYKVGYAILANGTETELSSFSIYSIKGQPSTEYTYSCSYVGSTTVRIHLYRADGSWIKQASNGNVDVTQTFITTEDTAEIRVSVYTAATPAIQLEFGLTATAYEQYFNGGSATAEMLLKVGDYKDEQEILSGAATRNVGVKVFDGTETLSFNVAGNTWTLFTSQWVCDGINPAICTHGTGDTTYSNVTTLNICAGSDNRLFISMDWATFGVNAETPNNEKRDALLRFFADQYAAGTPVIVVYPLATPTTESVIGQPLTVQAGTNIVEITQASIDNLTMEVSYRQKV